ncbi:ParB/RepB/Spo0J family partition protein [Aureimonas frigidaquae]|uniref:Chromosome partitioning protein ParB n=1 Tax=Aureimonas frigidaquae TaxID=424757 RepID=A0A0P0Z0L3_9HYPH|nr:ParB/RepB/Spo0J family partition protein [Aureimonas frigidaquae]BAT27515.1 chromosome partitioning protein ParB [Aureimonas frigidaquae]
MREDKSRARLGRGLASLIGGAPNGSAQDAASAGVNRGFVAQPPQAGERKVPVDSLVPNPKNPRRTFDDVHHGELVASVRNHGVVQPILVRKVPGQAGLEIVAGERRWRAAKAAGLTEVPVVLRDITDRESLEIALIENVQRADLNAIEEALGYEMLIDEHGYTQADLADILGKSRSHVANTLRLLKLPDSVRALVQRGDISPGAARAALGVEDPESFARTVISQGLTVRDAEQMARGEGAAPANRPRKGKADKAGTVAQPQVARQKDEDTIALERLLAEALDMVVTIDLQGEGGRITLDFQTLEQLDELCRRLQGGSATAE